MGEPQSLDDGVYRVGVTGHRHLRDSDDLAQRCAELLRIVRESHPHLAACSALAAGADTLFAESALGLGIPLEVVIPYTHYEDDFPTPAERTRYLRLRAAASRVIELPYTDPGPDAYLAAGRWILDHCQLLVAILDDRDQAVPPLQGGTANIVNEARGRAMHIHHIPATRGPDYDPEPEPDSTTQTTP
jgi:hypothetical protein